mgnify:CR=1 FL=1
MWDHIVDMVEFIMVDSTTVDSATVVDPIMVDSIMVDAIMVDADTVSTVDTTMEETTTFITNMVNIMVVVNTRKNTNQRCLGVLALAEMAKKVEDMEVLEKEEVEVEVAALLVLFVTSTTLLGSAF